MDSTGVLSYGNSDIHLKIEGLDPTLIYEIVLFGNRDRIEYSDRITKFCITGASTFTNLSSEGSIFSGINDDTTAIRNGYNTLDGYIARFFAVDPGEDGEVEILVTGDGILNRHYINVFSICTVDTLE